MSGPVARHLTGLGLPDEAARVYEFLLDTGSCARDRAAEKLGLDRPSLEAVIEHLQGLAMVSSSGEAEGQLTPLDPSAGLTLLALKRQTDLAVQERAARDAYAVHRRNFGTPSPSALEIVAAGDVQQRVAELERSAQQRIRTFDTAPYGGSTLENDIEIANLARGVAYRVLYVRSSLEDPEYFRRNVLPCVRAGEQARVLPEVPAKMIIVDDRVAMVSLTASHADTHHSSVLVQWCSLLPALIALFESYWEKAAAFTTVAPRSAATAGATRLRPVEQQLINLLATGVTDEIAARNLGLSRRTVTRHVERLMSLTGTSSRFQLALKAKEAGWTP